MVEAEEAAFSFDTYTIPSFSYKESGADDRPLHIKFNPSGRYIQKERKFELTVEFRAYRKGNKSKPIIKVTSIGIFKFREKISSNDIPDYFYANALAIMFPYIRAFISTLTLQANIRLIRLDLLNLSRLKQPLMDNTKVI